MNMNASRKRKSAAVVVVLAGIGLVVALGPWTDPKILPTNGNSVLHCDPDYDATCPPEGADDVPGVEPPGENPTFSYPPGPSSTASITPAPTSVGTASSQQP